MLHIALQSSFLHPYCVQTYLLIVSFLAAISGLILLKTDKTPAKDAMESADRFLIMMTFAYWLVYCVAFVLQNAIPLQWEIALLSVKLTRALAYLLTASCVLSLPLNRFGAQQPE